MVSDSGGAPDELVRSKASASSALDAIVVSLLRRRPSPRTSVQKLGLLVKAIIDRQLPEEFVSYYYGGFSEEVTESLSGLVDEGFARRSSGGSYELTSAGGALARTLDGDQKLGHIASTSAELLEFVAGLDDGEVVSLLYGLFPELTTASRIRDDVEARPLPTRVKITKVILQ